MQRATLPSVRKKKNSLCHVVRVCFFNNGKVWTKKDKDFDVTMGAQDGAEIAELTGIYLLKQVNDYLASLGEKSEAGLYRDDGLIYLEHANGPLISKIEKALRRIFKRNQLKITIEQKGHTVDFLDITLSTDGSHKPFKKPNSSLKYVSKASNHPPCIPRNIPSSIEKRLNTISSSEAEFNEAKTDYERALGNAGYSAELKYNAEQNRATRTSRKRRRRIVWYNPPFSKNVATNIGREFFKLLQLHFPKQHPLIKHSKHRNQTELSSLIWSLTDKGTDYKLTWNIIDRTRSYRPGKRTFNLCMSENSTSLLERTFSTRRPSCSTSAPTAENCWKKPYQQEN